LWFLPPDCQSTGLYADAFTFTARHGNRGTRVAGWQKMALISLDNAVIPGSQPGATEAGSVIQGCLKFLELLGAYGFLDLGSQLLQLVDIAGSFHREIEPKAPQAQGGSQPRGNGVGP